MGVGIMDKLEWIEKKFKEVISGGARVHGYWMRFLATSCGALVTHIGIVLIGAWFTKAWSPLVTKMLEWPVQGALGFIGVILFWGAVVASVKGGQFIRCFWRGLTIPVYAYYFLSLML